MFWFRLILGISYASVAGASKKALFLIGDSTYAQLYAEKLVARCNGVVDPRALKNLEHSACTNASEPKTCHYAYEAYVCGLDAPFSQIGYALHWGVGAEPYHVQWPFHRSPNDTLNSVRNIELAAEEFVQRSNGTNAYYVFLSVFWDIRRYLDHFTSTSTWSRYIQQYEDDLISTITMIRQKIRKTDNLALATCHLPAPWLSSYACVMNSIVRKTAGNLHTLGIELFDEAQLFDNTCSKDYLKDDMHQNSVAAEKILEMLIRTVAPDYYVSATIT